MPRAMFACVAFMCVVAQVRAEDKLVWKDERHENNGNAEVWVWVTVSDVGQRYKVEVKVKAQVNNRSGTAHCLGGLIGFNDDDPPKTKVSVLKHLTVGGRTLHNTTDKEE